MRNQYIKAPHDMNKNKKSLPCRPMHYLEALNPTHFWHFGCQLVLYSINYTRWEALLRYLFILGPNVFKPYLQYGRKRLFNLGTGKPSASITHICRILRSSSERTITHEWGGNSLACITLAVGPPAKNNTLPPIWHTSWPGIYSRFSPQFKIF